MAGRQGVQTTGVFIHSAAHSGSTWVGYVLGSSAESLFVGELYRGWDDDDRVPCTVCAGKGLAQCEVLCGLERMAPEDAFATLSARTGRRVIVDNSKKSAWTRRLVADRRQDMRLVHVLKDPRGWYASVRRRNTADLDWCMGRWCEDNEAIARLIRSVRLPCRVVMYDLLARDPVAGFRSLFRFCGIPFSPRAIAYWNSEHHGFAANGASAAVLRHARIASPPAHFATADDGFYDRVWSRSFVDERWKQELSEAECDRIAGNARVRRLLRQFGFALTPHGVAPARRPGLHGALAALSHHLLPPNR